MKIYPSDRLPRQYDPKVVVTKKDDMVYMSGFRQWLRSRGIMLCDPTRLAVARREVEELASQSGYQFLLPIPLL
jgi:hypothetical protein